jgi:hemoglobin
MVRMTGVYVSLILLGCGGGSRSTATAPAAVADGDDAPAEPAEPDTRGQPGAPAARPPAAKSLFDRLGGLPAITAVVDEFVTRTTTDPRIKDRFFNTDAGVLRRLLTEFVCMATGGPCRYTGRDMESSHAGMEVVDDEFTALVENLSGALDKFKVPDKEKGELLGALGPLKPQIVAPPDQLVPIDDAKLAPVTRLAAAMASKDPAAAELLNLAVVAGKRGQRSYAEQLFSRAEMLTGPRPLAALAGVFRAGAPPRVMAALKTLPVDTAAQPQVAGGSEVDDPDRKPAAGSLRGSIKIDGKPPTGLGVVMLWPEKGGKKRVAKQRIIEQRGKTFAPHVTAVPVGSTVSFPNFDPIFHNVFSLSKAKPFDLGMYKNGETREVKVDKPGIVRLGCNLHANMSAYLIVVEAPHYVVVDSDGTYSFRSLAPGKYKVQAWNEQSGEPMTTSVTIKPGANEGDLELTGGGQRVSPDKFGAPRT